MAEKSSYHLPLKIALRAVINVLLVWYLTNNFFDYIAITGGIGAYVVIGSLLTLMNLFVRPVLNLLSIPLKLTVTMLAIVVVNGIFLWLITLIVALMDPSIIIMNIRGGIPAWIILSLILGMANWAQKLVIR